MSRRSEILRALRDIGDRDDVALDLAETALLLAAADRPGAEIDRYRDYLAALAAEAAAAAGTASGLAGRVALLRRVLVERHRYRGDQETYEDVRNANLIDVIDRRRGLPVTLGILYIHAARACGWDIVGLGFPSHFLVRIEARGQRAIIDPFHQGRAMTAEDLRRRLRELHGTDAKLEPVHHAPVPDRDILVRLQNNIKLRALHDDDPIRACAVLETMTAIAPRRTGLWCEAAVLHHRLGNLKTAITLLERLLAGGIGVAEIPRVEDLLRQLRARLH
ncbi:MAG: SirB1 family protein [Rhodospirillales bacterium]